MDEAPGGKIRKFATFARVGFYVTCIGIAGHAAVSVLSTTYLTAKLIEKGVLGCLIAGFALSLLAITTGRSAKIGFQTARSLYILAGLSLIVSGWGLAIMSFEFFRRILWRVGVSI